MTDTPDFSTFTWSNSQQSAQADPVDPSSYSQQTSSYDTSQQQPSQRQQQQSTTDAYPSRNSPLNGASGSSSSARDNPNQFTFAFGPSTSQATSQSGYYNGSVETSQPTFGTDASGYTPIDPALTAGPPRPAGTSFAQGQSSQQASGDSPYLSTHIPPPNFNPGRRYSTPALSSTTTTPYTIPHRQNMYPPSYSQRHSDTSSFAQPQPRSPAFSSPMRSTQITPQGGYTGPLDRRMSMPTNSLWQLAHQTATQPHAQSTTPHSDPRPRQHSMVDWRMGSQSMPSRVNQNLLADLDASQGMLSLRGTQWGQPSSSDQGSLDFGSELDERRPSYDTTFLPSGAYGDQRRASVDSNATQPGSVLGDGMKKHTCPICHKKFTRPSSLQTHMYSHTGEKRIIHFRFG